MLSGEDVVADSDVRDERVTDSDVDERVTDSGASLVFAVTVTQSISCVSPSQQSRSSSAQQYLLKLHNMRVLLWFRLAELS